MSDEKAKNAPSASVQITGETGENFLKLKYHMEQAMPGVKVDRSSVVRHALHLAAAGLRPVDDLIHNTGAGEKNGQN